ncbi:kielin/chordin-like protein [Centruroides sculpturatus]|uniref:kielin/chordin-like protein n=1 Tax=Centruroides sculpturatus TaxID=218467 RepID=UPI000C6CD82F|nr:kielin/chordin-like protein [Centruroides sculpturatus]
MLHLQFLIIAVIISGTISRSIRSTEEVTENHLECTCDKRYLSHYEVKGCYPIYDRNNSACPSRFECLNNQTDNTEMCVYKGQYYSVGSSINTGNNCQKCQCVRNSESKAYIACAGVECPHNFRRPPISKGCRLVYEENHCCPTKTECDLEKLPKCELNNKTYYLGEHIYPEEDPCLICLCDKDWKGLKSKSCRKIDCIFERKFDLLKRGCIPVYHEKTCCPIEYYCPETQESAPKNESEIEEKSENECFFDGKRYKIGEKLNYKQELNCTTCTCCTPPDFTCIHQSCPPPPNNDYENCKANYKQGICCPEYDCKPKHVAEELILGDQSIMEESVKIGPPPSENPCNEMECADGKHCQLRQVKCDRSFCPLIPTCKLFCIYSITSM